MAGKSPFEVDPVELDDNDPLKGFRDDFWVPTKTQFDQAHIRTSMYTSQDVVELETPSQITYLCGNSLGLQPKSTSDYVNSQLDLWRSKGVHGHFEKSDSVIPPWIDIDEAALEPMACIVGARPTEIAIMQTLSANLHILFSSFYKPHPSRYKIMIEAKSFPSDHFIVESQLKHHGVDINDGLILLHPPDHDSPCLSTDHILKCLEKHASELAIVLLPGIQFFTGQLFDIERITKHAHQHGVVIGWDLAHAVGNVPLKLHEWNVDFAAWCNYKYMNAGPGCIGSLFVHTRHTHTPDVRGDNETTVVTNGEDESTTQGPKLQGWWGSTKASRFTMNNIFEPMTGAASFQLSNPSVLDISALLASLNVFKRTDIVQLREKSIKLTGYLQGLLESTEGTHEDPGHGLPSAKPVMFPYKIITPLEPEQRGAQLSIQLEPALLEHVMAVLEREHIIVDVRKPDVIRVAPAPLYNTFQDCRHFVDVFKLAVREMKRV